jgi:precorrin-2 dehydrogenase/sirohydrochlorin ferrochelatase
MSERNDLFPIFIKLSQVDTLVVGGGNVGLEKLGALLGSDPSAHILVVAREATEALKAFILDFPRVKLEERPFELADLENRQLVVCATGDPVLNETIREATRERRILLNIADTPDLCDFYLSSTVTKGNLKIAISTNGKSPTLAKRLKEIFADALPEEVDEVLLHLSTLRNRMKGDLPEKIRKLNDITRGLALRSGARGEI